MFPCCVHSFPKGLHCLPWKLSEKSKKSSSFSVIDFPFPRAATVWCPLGDSAAGFPQQVVVIATGSHVVKAAIGGRAVAVGRRGEERGGEGRRRGWVEGSGRLLIELIRSQLQKAAVSWYLVRNILDKHTLFVLCVHVTVCVCCCEGIYSVFVCVCVVLCMDVFQIRVVQNPLLRRTVVFVCVTWDCFTSIWHRCCCCQCQGQRSKS